MPSVAKPGDLPLAVASLAQSLGDHRMVDLTRLLEASIPTYPTHPKFFQMRWCSMGDPAEMNQLIMGEHTGTHLDAPSTFVPTGPQRRRIHELPLEIVHRAVREADVRSVPEANAIVTSSTSAPGRRPMSQSSGTMSSSSTSSGSNTGSPVRRASASLRIGRDYRPTRPNISPRGG